MGFDIIDTPHGQVRVASGPRLFVNGDSEVVFRVESPTKAFSKLLLERIRNGTDQSGGCTEFRSLRVTSPGHAYLVIVGFTAQKPDRRVQTILDMLHPAAEEPPDDDFDDNPGELVLAGVGVDPNRRREPCPRRGSGQRARQ